MQGMPGTHHNARIQQQKDRQNPCLVESSFWWANISSTQATTDHCFSPSRSKKKKRQTRLSPLPTYTALHIIPQAVPMQTHPSFYPCNFSEPLQCGSSGLLRVKQRAGNWVKWSSLSVVAGRERKEETPLLVLIILTPFHCNNNKSKQGLAQWQEPRISVDSAL